MSFDKKKLIQISEAVNYLLGQLGAVHDGIANLVATNGFEKYDGTKWTQNKIALFALYYLGTVTGSMPMFMYLDAYKNYVSPIFTFKDILIPTLSPNDPNFDKQTIFE